jgi:hypothetical protein
VSRVWLRCGGAIQRAFKKGCQPVDGRLLGARHPLRRHRAGPQLSDHLFPVFRIARDIGKIRALQRKPTRAHLVAVTGYAILVQNGRMRRGIFRARGNRPAHRNRRRQDQPASQFLQICLPRRETRRGAWSWPGQVNFILLYACSQCGTRLMGGINLVDTCKR